MRRPRLLPVLKLLLAAGLIAFVLSRVDLRDSILLVDAAAEQRLEGTFLTSWKADEVEFLAQDGRTLRFVPGAEVAGRTIQVRPGMLTYVRDLHAGWFLLGALLHFLAGSSCAFRWRWLVRVHGLPLTCWQAFRLTWIGVFFNNVVPGLTGGDLVKAFYLVRHTGERTRSIVSVVVDRLMGLMALGILAAVVVLFHLEQFKELALGIYAVLAVTSLMAVLVFSRRIRRALHLDALLARLPLAGLLRRVDEAFRFYRAHLRGMGLWLLFSVANHAVAVMAVYCIGTALQVGMPWYGYLVLVPVINMVSAVPIAPAGWGVGETLFGFLFKTYGHVYLPGVAQAGEIMGTRGVVLSLVYRFHLVCWSLLGGIFLAFSRDRMRPTRAEEALTLSRQEATAP